MLVFAVAGTRKHQVNKLLFFNKLGVQADKLVNSKSCNFPSSVMNFVSPEGDAGVMVADTRCKIKYLFKTLW